MTESARGPDLKRSLASRSFMLGKLCAIRPRTVSEAAAVCIGLAKRQFSTTVGKFSTSEDDPDLVVDEYRRASRIISASGVEGSRFYLSVKPPALRFDPKRADDVAAVALDLGQGVHFDSHGFDLAVPTLSLLDELIARRQPVTNAEGRWQFGLTLPSRWKRSAADAEWAVDHGIRVRLVKGEFRAPDAQDETDPSRSFLALVDTLAGRVPSLAIATHDVGLAREALIRAQGADRSVELELLYRWPSERLVTVAREMGVPVGFYVPYGELLLMFAVRHLLTHPRKLTRGNYLRSWLGRDASV